MSFNLSPYLLTIRTGYNRVFSYHRALINNALPLPLLPPATKTLSIVTLSQGQYRRCIKDFIWGRGSRGPNIFFK